MTYKIEFKEIKAISGFCQLCKNGMADVLDLELCLKCLKKSENELKDLEQGYEISLEEYVESRKLAILLSKNK